MEKVIALFGSSIHVIDSYNEGFLCALPLLQWSIVNWGRQTEWETLERYLVENIWEFRKSGRELTKVMIICSLSRHILKP